MAVELDDLIPTQSTQLRTHKRFLPQALSGALVAAIFVGTSIAPTGATNGAHFTSLERRLINADNDGHADDVEFTFEEVGVGGETVSIRATAVREISATCVSAVGEFDVDEQTTPVADYSTGEDPGDSEATVTTDDNGRISGTGVLGTDVQRVCPDFHPGFDGTSEGAVFLLADYSVSYRDVTVTDIANGGATASISEPVTYEAECVVTNQEAYLHWASATFSVIAELEAAGSACPDELYAWIGSEG